MTELALLGPMNGPIERRANSLVPMQGDRGQFDKLRTYLDTSVSDDEIRRAEPRFMKSSGEFESVSARQGLAGKIEFNEERIQPYLFKPMDSRLAYLDASLHPLFSRPSPELLNQQMAGNYFFVTRDRADAVPEGIPVYFSATICDYHLLGGEARHFPMVCRSQPRAQDQTSFSDHAADPVPNISAAARQYLETTLGQPAGRQDSDTMWLHTFAVGVSSAYLSENGADVRQDFPHIPLPAKAAALRASAELGRRVAALLDVESAVDTVTAGTIRHELRPVGLPWTADGGQIDPGAGDLAVTAGWGHAGQGGATMPGRGHLVERPYTEEELATFREGLTDLGLSFEQLMSCLGGSCVDVYINERTYWRCVPARVWSYTIGGYQVMKKWLSYRERPLLGRDLTPDEARNVMEMARRIAAILLLEPALDANYENVKAETYAWSGVRSDA